MTAQIRRSLTVGQLRDLVQRCRVVLMDSAIDTENEHHELRAELYQLECLCNLVIGGSHMGVAADQVILEREHLWSVAIFMGSLTQTTLHGYGSPAEALEAGQTLAAQRHWDAAQFMLMREK